MLKSTHDGRYCKRGQTQKSRDGKDTFRALALVITFARHPRVGFKPFSNGFFTAQCLEVDGRASGLAQQLAKLWQQRICGSRGIGKVLFTRQAIQQDGMGLAAAHDIEHQLKCLTDRSRAGARGLRGGRFAG